MTENPVLIQWMFDTRAWFPEASETRQLETHPQACRMLALLPPSERTAALKYYHVRDAKMAMASSLLKHVVLAKLLPTLPWHATVITRDHTTGKPGFVSPEGMPGVSFNVTHQAGLVAVVAARSALSGSPLTVSDSTLPGDTASETMQEQIQLGVDLVCTSERRSRDHALITADGWPRFVDMHADVFSPRETSYLKYQILSAIPGLIPRAATSEDMLDAKLRAFYALWALREAYVKLTGDALLASWLGELEFRGFRPVAPTPGWEVPAREEDDDGEGNRYGPQVINRFDIWFKGRRVDDVNISLRAMGSDYMICTAVRTPGRKEVGLGWKLRPYQLLDLDDMLEFAEARMQQSSGSWPS